MHRRAQAGARAPWKGVGQATVKLGLTSWVSAGLVAGALFVFVASPSPALARAATDGTDAAVALSALPPEAQKTFELIQQGGPFPYSKDGVVFGNRERLLPTKPRGHYREYTVKTPKSRDRGPRRIVCGGRQPSAPEACWYTADHYASFKRIVH